MGSIIVLNIHLVGDNTHNIKKPNKMDGRKLAFGIPTVLFDLWAIPTILNLLTKTSDMANFVGVVFLAFIITLHFLIFKFYKLKSK